MTPIDIKVLRVLLYNRPIGTLTRLPGDKNLFAFDEDYIKNPSRPVLSLSFKDSMGDLITDIKITRTRLPPFFANLLPEGPFRDYLMKRANVHSTEEFLLLGILGQDLPGAITVQGVDSKDLSLYQELTQWETEKKKESPLRFSLAGVQLKFSAIEKGGHGFVIPANGVGGGWIVKLPHSVFRGIPENEYSMMELARKVGIDVPEIALYPLEKLQGLPKDLKRLGDNAFTIKRFDRTEEGDKIHTEDFAQVFGVYPEQKYKSASYRNIAEVIWKEIGEAGVIEFIRRFVFNALIGNGDMHLKNWSFIYREKNKASLAPAYDFVSTILYLPEDQLALKFAGSRDFEALTLTQFQRFAEKAHLPKELVLKTTQETVQAFYQAWKTVKDLPLQEEVRNAIAKHLKTVPLWKLG
ncbi:MAG: HipA domain-containing protein [Verrucomicrobiota bacterium]|nr:HipA domain-containing protein [Verrucomicrobiota bacterium]